MYKFIDNNDYITVLFKKMARSRRVPSIVNNNIETNLIFEDRKGESIYIDTDKFTDRSSINISFIFRNVNYLFATTIQKTEKKSKIERPKEIKAFFRRFLERYKIENNSSIKLKIENETFKIKNITTQGLAFYSVNAFEYKTILRNVELTFNSESIILDLEIKNIQSKENIIIYGAKFEKLEWFNFNKIFSFIMFNKYPNINYMDNYSRNDIKNLYIQTGFFGRNENFIQSNFESVLNTIKNNKNKYSFLTYFCTCNDKEILSSSSTVRIYQNTYMAQHLAYSEKSRRHPSAIKNNFAVMGEMLFNNPNFGYYLSYINKSLGWNKDTFKKITDYINNKDIYVFDEINIFRFNIDENVSYKGLDDYEILNQKDPCEFISYCESNLSKVEVGCYDYTRENFFLDTIKEIYSQNGFFCNRKLYEILHKNVKVAYAVADVYSNGINFSNLLDTCKFYFLRDNEAKDITKACISELMLFYKKYKKNTFFIISKSAKLAELKELEKRALDCRIMGTKLGTKEFVDNFRLIYD
jgi:hypothetical protein